MLDVVLGTLAVFLRLCGYTAAYAGDRGVHVDDLPRELAGPERIRLLALSKRERVFGLEQRDQATG